MSKLDLSKYGINDVKEIIHNPSYDFLFKEETREDLEGFEKGQLTELGAVNVMTGEFTGRSPKDKYIVEDSITKDTIWWNSPQAPNDNKPISPEVWKELKQTSVDQLSGKRLFVMDTFAGANRETGMMSLPKKFTQISKNEVILYAKSYRMFKFAKLTLD